MNELKRYLFLRGSSVVGCHARIRRIVKEHVPDNVKAGKLKDEYGVGGGTITLPGYQTMSYDSKGIKVIEDDNDEIKFSWNDVLKFTLEGLENLLSIKEVGEHLVYELTGEVIEPKFNYHTCPEDYTKEGVVWIEPMTAKEEQNEVKLEDMLKPDSGYISEEKFDGTRGTIHLSTKGNRVFSRTVSRKTGWFVENTDLLPHIRDLEIPSSLEGTILDGEMMIEDRPFKDVSSTMNCNWDKAIRRQLELGFVTLKAFDIVRYKGINVQNMPLNRRKYYLEKVVKELAFFYIKEVDYSDSELIIPAIDYSECLLALEKDKGLQEKYPTLYEEMKPQYNGFDVLGCINLGKKAYYELIVLNGGEGIILKNLNGKYYNKRTKEYVKIKKFDTWDVIVIGFSDPKKDYDGKTALKDWTYWCNPEEDVTWEGKQYNPDDIPVTKYYARGWIGAIRYGVIVTDEEIEALKNKAPKEKFEFHKYLGIGEGRRILYIGECSGMTEEVRNEISENPAFYMNKVMEIKGQEVIKKTGKIRHTRFLRFREDKNVEDCIWKDHIRD